MARPAEAVNRWKHRVDDADAANQQRDETDDDEELACRGDGALGLAKNVVGGAERGKRELGTEDGDRLTGVASVGCCYGDCLIRGRRPRRSLPGCGGNRERIARPGRIIGRRGPSQTHRGQRARCYQHAHWGIEPRGVERIVEAARHHSVSLLTQNVRDVSSGRTAEPVGADQRKRRRMHRANRNHLADAARALPVIARPTISVASWRPTIAMTPTAMQKIASKVRWPPRSRERDAKRR
jgi:hypothetical protein